MQRSCSRTLPGMPGPGDVAFEVRGLKLDGRDIPLKGGETLEGANHYTQA